MFVHVCVCAFASWSAHKNNLHKRAWLVFGLKKTGIYAQMIFHQKMTNARRRKQMNQMVPISGIINTDWPSPRAPPIRWCWPRMIIIFTPLSIKYETKKFRFGLSGVCKLSNSRFQCDLISKMERYFLNLIRNRERKNKRPWATTANYIFNIKMENASCRWFLFPIFDCLISAEHTIQPIETKTKN